MSEELVIRFFAAIEAGDLGTLREIYAPDALIWHNDDLLEQSVDDNLKVLQERNREDARERLFDMIRQAAVRPTPRRPTKVPKAQRRERLETKKHRSGIKTLRRSKPGWD